MENLDFQCKNIGITDMCTPNLVKQYMSQHMEYIILILKDVLYIQYSGDELLTGVRVADICSFKLGK